MRVSILVLAALSLAACKKKPTEPVVPDDPAVIDAGTSTVDPLAPALPVETREERVRRVMTRSLEQLRLEDPTVAREVIEDLKALTADRPDAAEIPFNIGVAYELLGDDTNARKAYLRATDIDPSLGEAWLNLGALAESRGEFDRALQSYQAGLRYAPDNAGLIVGAVGALRRQGRYAQAITESKKALGQNANNVEIYNNLGLVYLAQGQTDLASFVYQKALNEIEGADANAYLHANLGKVHLARDETYLASQELKRALELDPTMVPAMIALAGLDMDDHNWADAAALLERARDRRPDDAAILINLGICYRGLGRYEESQALYERALDLDPRNADPYLNLAVLQGDYMRAYDAALASIDRYLVAGGKEVALAEQWRTDLVDAKGKYQKEVARKQRREERDKKRAEEERLAAEHDRIQAAARAAADAALGNACPDTGCPELTACNREGVCVDDGAPGTSQAGQACESDDDCSFGLMCGPDASCAPGAALDTTPAPAPAPAPADIYPAPAPAPPDIYPAPPDAPAEPAPGGEGSEGTESSDTPDPWTGEQ